MAKKYVTNPLEDDVLRRAEEARQPVPEPQFESPTQPLEFEARTRPFASVKTAEMPTQKFDDFNIAEPYQSVFARPQTEIENASVSTAVQTQHVQPLTSRRVSGLGMPEKWAMVLPYLPFTTGAILGVVILFYAKRTETRVRFHAAQALALHLASWIIGIFLSFGGEFAPFGGINEIFQLAVFVYFIVSIVRVWNGKANHIAALDDVTDFLNEKIKPRK